MSQCGRAVQNIGKTCIQELGIPHNEKNPWLSLSLKLIEVLVDQRLDKPAQVFYIWVFVCKRF
jgi:hypothetical protein